MKPSWLLVDVVKYRFVLYPQFKICIPLHTVSPEEQPGRPHCQANICPSMFQGWVIFDFCCRVLRLHHPHKHSAFSRGSFLVVVWVQSINWICHSNSVPVSFAFLFLCASCSFDSGTAHAIDMCGSCIICGSSWHIGDSLSVFISNHSEVTWISTCAHLSCVKTFLCQQNAMICSLPRHHLWGLIALAFQRFLKYHRS